MLFSPRKITLLHNFAHQLRYKQRRYFSEGINEYIQTKISTVLFKSLGIQSLFQIYG